MIDTTAPSALTNAATQGLDSSWLPFTPQRYFRDHPKVLTSAEGAYYTLSDGRRVFDCLSGLWCCPLGHAQPKIVEALTRQAQTLDYATAFQFAHPAALTLAERIVAAAPQGMDRVFFTNSGSEAVDTALQMAYGYHRLRGQGGRTRFIGRERGYHGVGFGGMSVGGMVANRKMFAPLMLNGVDHIRHTYDERHTAFCHGQPAWGAHLADDLERLVALHDASTIAAVIVEPVAGSTGVLPPPVGYLQRLRDICTRHGILLVFDEVITGFGRLGAPFAAQALGVTPDLMTFAKGVTNGVAPMGGVIAKADVFDTFMQADGAPYAVEFMHGHTYSGHPLAAAVGHAALDLMFADGLIEQGRGLQPVLEEAVHALRDEVGVIGIRNIGLAAAIDLDPVESSPGLRALTVFEQGLDEGLMLRFTGDTIAVAPPFISTPSQLHAMGEGLRRAIRKAFA